MSKSKIEDQETVALITNPRYILSLQRRNPKNIFLSATRKSTRNTSS